MFYVNPTLNPNPDCPKDKPCHTLDEYALNSRKYFESSSNLSLIFLKGVHNLTSSDLIFSDIKEIHLTSFGVIANIQIKDGQGMIFENLSRLRLSHLSIASTKVSESRIKLFNVLYYNQQHLTVLVSEFHLVNVVSVFISDSNYTNSFLNISQGFSNTGFTPGIVGIEKCSMYSTQVSFTSRPTIIASPWTLKLNESSFSSDGDGYHQAIVVSIIGNLIYSPTLLNITNCLIAQNSYGLSITVAGRLYMFLRNTSVIGNDKVGVSAFVEHNGLLELSFEQCEVARNKDGVIGTVSENSTIKFTVEDSTITNQTNNGIALSLFSTQASVNIVRSYITHCSRAGLEFDVSEKLTDLTVDIIQATIMRCAFGLMVFFSADNNYLKHHDHVYNMTVQSCLFSQNSANAIKVSPNTPPVSVEPVQQGAYLHMFLESDNFTESKYEGVVVDVPTFIMANVTLSNCKFQANSGVSLKVRTSELDMMSFFTLQNFIAVDNYVSSQELPITAFIGSGNVLVEDCLFINNRGTPIQRQYGTLFVSGNNTFANNTGFQGGAMSLIASQLYLFNNTILAFQNNHAIDVGGGMYVQKKTSTGVTVPQCFYQVPSEPELVDSLDIQLLFVSNSADRGGSQIYGAALRDDCTIVESNSDVPSTSVEKFKEYFYFNTSQLDSTDSQISSDPKRVCLCNTTNGDPIQVCASVEHIFVPNRLLYPGETFNVSAVVVGDEFGTLSSTVYANLISIWNHQVISLGKLQDSQTVYYQQCSNLTYSVHFDLNTQVSVVLKVNQAATSKIGDVDSIKEKIKQEITQYHENKVIPTNLLTTPIFLNITLLNCPLGFEVRGDPPSCDCNTFLTTNDFSNCSIQNHEGIVYRTGTQWVGTMVQQNRSEVLLTQYCPFGYCSPELIPVHLDDPDKQCTSGRSNMLCGTCRTNLSLVLGSSDCQMCTNNSYLALVIAFALAGVTLVFFIKLLDLTVATATMNGLIFYANVVWANQNIILSTDKHSTIVGYILKVFLAWLNLDIGINTCFFVGMNAYWKTWLQFVFPIYIWTIAGLIIVVSKYSIKASRIFGNNSIPLLATLFLLSYSKLLRSTIKALSFTYLLYPNGYLAVWTEDGTVPYLSSSHAVLFTVALLCVVFLWAPFMLTLLFIQPLKRVDHLRPLRWINNWKPLFDAYTGPLKDKYHYWIGVLLLAREVILVTSAIASALVPRVNLLVVAVTTALLSLHTNMYKKWYLSLLEKSFLLNLSFLTCGLLYIDIVQDTVSKMAIAYTSVSITFLQFVCVVFHHVICKVKIWRQQRHGGWEECREIAAPVNDHQGEDYREPLIESNHVN